MKTKYCFGCKKERNISEFGKNKSKKDGLQTRCKECRSKEHKLWYSENKDLQRKRINKTRYQLLERNHNFLKDYLSDKICQDCGNSDIRVLEFDHLEDKKENVSRLVSGGWSLDKIKEEIDKCDIVCSNCHKIRTAERGNFYRAIW